MTLADISRAESNAYAKRVTSAPKQTPAVTPLDVSRFFLGQHMNASKALSRRDLHRAHVFSKRAIDTQPKRTPVRKHKQHFHSMLDQHGVITMVGSNFSGERRIWLGGISAQRGY